jgi:hypothetical protein
MIQIIFYIYCFYLAKRLRAVVLGEASGYNILWGDYLVNFFGGSCY